MTTENEIKKMFSDFTDSCSAVWESANHEAEMNVWFNNDLVGMKLLDKITHLESQKDWEGVKKVMDFYYKRLKKKIEDSFL